MADRVAFTRVSPVIPVRDLDAALERYRRLGFEVEAYSGAERYGFAQRDTVELHLSESDDHDPTKDGAVVYLYVADADAVLSEWRDAAVEGRFSEASDRPWGLREFGYVDPDGTLHRVGSPLATTH